MLIGFLFAALALPVVGALLRRSLKDFAPELIAPLTAVASLLLFSLMLHENWFSGTASFQLFLLRLVSVTLAWMLVRWPGQRKGVAGAMCCACTVRDHPRGLNRAAPIEAPLNVRDRLTLLAGYCRIG
jgi:hypothetical protein